MNKEDIMDQECQYYCIKSYPYSPSMPVLQKIEKSLNFISLANKKGKIVFSQDLGGCQSNNKTPLLDKIIDLIDGEDSLSIILTSSSSNQTFVLNVSH